MLTLSVFLIGLWFLGIVASVTFEGMIHLLLVVAIVTALKGIIDESSLRDAGT